MAFFEADFFTIIFKLNDKIEKIQQRFLIWIAFLILCNFHVLKKWPWRHRLKWHDVIIRIYCKLLLLILLLPICSISLIDQLLTQSDLNPKSCINNCMFSASENLPFAYSQSTYINYLFIYYLCNAKKLRCSPLIFLHFLNVDILKYLVRTILEWNTKSKNASRLLKLKASE